MKSGRKLNYPGEYIPIIECQTLQELGKLTALRFIEFVVKNPHGVVALPTGKTPEYFIHYIKHYKKNWHLPQVKQDLKTILGFECEEFPDTSNLHFCQLDEFYPIDPNHSRSFTAYIRQYYLPLLNLKEENIHMVDICFTGILKEKGIKGVFPNEKVDLSLLNREPKTELEGLQKRALNEMVQFCQNYDKIISSLGGIGFFLGGIGYDGHIAFNLRGSAMNSPTRWVTLNYETAAQQATDLGGIDFSRERTALTMGLQTITAKKDVVLIIIAAGESKAKMVADAIQCPKKDPLFPASSLLGLPNARFYITKGAGVKLPGRVAENIEKKFSLWRVIQGIMDISFQTKKPLIDLKEEDFIKFPAGQAILKKYSVAQAIQLAQIHMRESLTRGVQLPENKVILHTGPHHDDVMLSYYPLVKELFRKNKSQYFAVATSGFVSVTNYYIMGLLEKMEKSNFFQKYDETLLFEKELDDIIGMFIDAYKNKDFVKMDDMECIILCHAVCDAFKVQSIDKITDKINWMFTEYFPKKQPGEQDAPEIETLKGFMRETEEDRVWRIHGVHLNDLYHMRTQFYTGDYFKPNPTIEGDAKPFFELIMKYRPDIITVAYDPIGTGPDTHYRVLQIICDALRLCDESYQPQIWGYRNVWYRFHPSFSNIICPVTQQDFDELNVDFLNSYTTQKNAQFPSPEHDGPFSGLAEKIMREQIVQIKTLLGEKDYEQLKQDYPKVQNACGFLYLKQMTREQFLKSAATLSKGLL